MKQLQMEQIQFSNQGRQLESEAHEDNNIIDDNISVQIEQNQNKQNQGTGHNLQEKKSQAESINKSKPNVKKSIRSCFHNFQKHLVITLKTVIKIKQYKSSDRIKLISFKIWNIFKSIKKNNKNTLHALFGVANDYKQGQCHLSKSTLQKLGFLPIYQEFQLTQIESAQQNLRKQVTSQLRMLSDQYIFQHRKIQKREQFSIYVKKFIQQIQRGPMRKRIPKFKALQAKMSSQVKL